MIKPTIALITILTDDVPRLAAFYRHVVGLKPESRWDENATHVEFEMRGVRFAICARSVLFKAIKYFEYRTPPKGRSFELAFPVDSVAEVDSTYIELVSKGAQGVKGPENMPWNQRTAFFADPDGNVHEIFADL